MLERWRSHVARCGLLQRPDLTSDGLVLGARTLLAASFYHPDETAAHDRLVALLATVYGGRVNTAAPPRIAKALAVWRSGDRALAGCHLALARLQPVSFEDAYRLFLASLALDEGLEPSVLLREIGATEAARLLKFNPLEPRIPAGNGRISGDWTAAVAARQAMTPPCSWSPQRRRNLLMLARNSRLILSTQVMRSMLQKLGLRVPKTSVYLTC